MLDARPCPPSMKRQCPGPTNPETAEPCAWEPCTNLVDDPFWWCSDFHMQQWMREHNEGAA
ncbi:hypothetical protein JD82_00374 [Prauserella rugosa]|uniref:Uncharacterized protein n=1 Tax=Prauserella rugosa TaxID=43354 RepID=A0A660CCJ5_9PSEU|nr:hypothetical protein JD82_00374 [Prauserella rugosa]